MSAAMSACQLPPRWGRGKGRKFIKRQTSKLMRRKGKRLHEDTPVRVIKGWAD